MQHMKHAIGTILLLHTLVAWANPAQDQLMALPEAQRAKLFAALLQRSGERCPSVSRVFYQGSANGGDAFWNVACAGADSWVITIANNSTGSTKLLSCKVLEAMKAGKCFRGFKRR